MTLRYQATSGRPFCGLVLGMAIVLGPVPVHAQDAGALEEVTVTAQRRAENVQDVPIAVTALGGESIRDADISNPGEIASRVPGMAYASFAPGQALIAIRGITSADDGAGMENSVALFLDDVYIGRIASIDFDLVDLERIEVLRGPQGTLYGKNAIGGAINVITSKPTDEVTARFDLATGNKGIFNVAGLLSGPLSDSVSAKLVVSSREHDGYVRNIILNEDQQDDDVRTIRGQLRWEGDQSEVLVSIDDMRERRDDMGRRPVANGSAPVVDIFQSLGAGFHDTAAPVDGFSNRDSDGISVKWGRDFDQGGSLLVIGANRNAETDWEMASVGVPLIGGAGDVIDDIMEDIDQTQFEIRWSDDLGDDLRYISGFFYLNEEVDRTERFRVVIPGVGEPAVDVSAQKNETDSYALFGQLTWDFNPQWALDVGARYTFEEKTTFSDSVSGGFGVINDTFMATASDDWDDFSPKVALNYRPTENVLLYGSIASGFKSGGFQGAPGRISDATTPVDPETAVNYEIGLKSDLAENRVRFNATAFFTDYQDLQIVRFGPPLDDPTAFGSFTTRNAADAELKGLELELTALITDYLQFAANYAYLDTEFKDFIFFDANNNPLDLSGRTLRQAPENSYAVALDYAYPVTASGAEIRARLDFRHMDEQLHDVLNLATKTDEFDLLDARIGWRSADQSWEVALWGKNLADEEYISHAYTIGPGVIGIAGAPRTYGLSFTYQYQ